MFLLGSVLLIILVFCVVVFAGVRVAHLFSFLTYFINIVHSIYCSFIEVVKVADELCESRFNPHSTNTKVKQYK